MNHVESFSAMPCLCGGSNGRLKCKVIKQRLARKETLVVKQENVLLPMELKYVGQSNISTFLLT